MPTLHHVKVYLSGACQDLLALHGKTAQVPSFPSDYVFIGAATADSPPTLSDAVPYLIAGIGQSFRSESGGVIAAPKGEDFIYLTLPVLQFLTWEAEPRLLVLLRKAFPRLRFNEQITPYDLSID